MKQKLVYYEVESTQKRINEVGKNEFLLYLVTFHGNVSQFVVSLLSIMVTFRVAISRNLCFKKQRRLQQTNNSLKINFLANIEFCLKSKHQKKEDQKDRKKAVSRCFKSFKVLKQKLPDPQQKLQYKYTEHIHRTKPDSTKRKEEYEI